MTNEEKTTATIENHVMRCAMRESVLDAWSALENAEGWISRKRRKAEAAAFDKILDDIDRIFRDNEN